MLVLCRLCWCESWILIRFVWFIRLWMWLLNFLFMGYCVWFIWVSVIFFMCKQGVVLIVVIVCRCVVCYIYWKMIRGGWFFMKNICCWWKIMIRLLILVCWLMLVYVFLRLKGVIKIWVMWRILLFIIVRCLMLLLKNVVIWCVFY